MKINRGGKLLGYTQFRKMWSSDFEDVVIPKVHLYHFINILINNNNQLLLSR